MIIPKILAQNSGFDPQESIIKLQVCCAIVICFSVFTFEFLCIYVILLSLFDRKSTSAVASLLAWTYHQVCVLSSQSLAIILIIDLTWF